MKKPLLVITILAVISLVAFAIYYYFNNGNSPKKDNNNTQQKPSDNKPKVDNFPEDINVFSESGENGEWKYRLFQGKIKEYAERDGLSYAIVEYENDVRKDASVNILLQIKKELAPAIMVDDRKNSDGNLYEIFANRYINHLTVYSGQKSSENPGAKKKFSLEQFKLDYPAGSYLAFKLLEDYPDSTVRTRNYCYDRSDPVTCAYGDLSDKYTKGSSLELFWKKEDVSDSNILIQKGIYTSLFLKDNQECETE